MDGAVLIRWATGDDVEAISLVIQQAIRITNARDYAPHVIDRVVGKFTPPMLAARLAKRTVFVAVSAGTIVGTAGLEDAAIQTVFVHPDFQGQGIGLRLIAQVEQTARAKGIDRVTVRSTITAEAFYGKLGFVRLRDMYDGEERTILMEKRL